MDLIIIQPYLNSRGGAERVVQKLSEKFNAPIYTFSYKPGQTFSEFGECDIREIRPRASLSAIDLLAPIDRNSRIRSVGKAGLHMLGMKIREDYDILNPHLPPSEWIRNRNERVCWFCHGQNAGFKGDGAMLLGRTAGEKIVLKTGKAAYRAVESRLVKRIEKICTCSEYTKGNIEASFGRDDVSVAHPGVEPGEFSCGAFDRYFLCVSRISPEKRIEFAIRAFKEFDRGGKWKLVIAGQLADMPRNRQYLESLKELAGGANVSFEINRQDAEMKRLYSDCYAFLCPSIAEDWGIVVLEAMASSKPVIAANRGGPTESVKDGETGFLVSSQREMAGKMSYLAQNPSENEAMGKKGRKRVAQNYTWGVFLEKMGRAYRETAKKA
ncbi:MAG: glycosyltransferase family 4 protein [Candidatus Micrarchaeia archaeon]